LTNITHEHLDYHKTYENYLKAKEKLLHKAKICIVNIDDSSYKFLAHLKIKKSKDNWITYGLLESADFNPKIFDISSLNLLEDFNKYNVLAAAAACLKLGVKESDIKKSLKTFVLPKGRQEIVYENSFKVMIDFAHTPNAFENILNSLRPKIKGRIIHVFGSAGERDSFKRPIMGEISSKYSDIVILTAEDPRRENVNDIISQIESGIKNKNVEIIKISDRKKAIEEAIRIAKKDDLVLITGKAHEKSMNYGNQERPWDEFAVVRRALKNIKNSL
jgi:UDP-N-acetylmuramoyl-L-alanyl-D-glutamate--2,6-diaminopimelate ligase